MRLFNLSRDACKKNPRIWLTTAPEADHIDVNVAPSTVAPPERYATALHPREDSASPAFSALYAGLRLTNAVPKIHEAVKTAKTFGLGTPDMGSLGMVD